MEPPVAIIHIHSVSELGEVVRHQRKRQKLRQQDLADQVDASHVLLRQLEKGKPTVQVGRVLRVLEELGIEVHLDVPDDRLAASTRTPE